MKREIVVFERENAEGEWELDFRLPRMSLPVGSSPLAIVLGDGFVVVEGQGFFADEIIAFAEVQSGYTYHKEEQ